MFTHRLHLLPLLLFLSQYSLSLSLRDLIPWSRSVDDSDDFEGHLAYLHSQIGKRRLGCPITAAAINFTHPTYYSNTLPAEDLEECRAKDASSLYKVLNKTQLVNFAPGACERNSSQAQKLFQCIARVVDDLRIGETALQKDLLAFSGQQSWFGCEISIFPWQNGFYEASSSNLATQNDSSNEVRQIEDVLDSLAFCTKSDSRFMHNILFGTADGQLAYEAAPLKKGVRSCSRSDAAIEMLECIQMSALKFNRFRDIVESARPLCNNANLWVTSFLHSQNQFEVAGAKDDDGGSEKSKEEVKLSKFESEFRYDFFRATQEANLAELVENYKISLKIETVKMLECLAGSPIPPGLFNSLNYRPVRMRLSKILGRNTNELLTTFILILLGLALLLVIATWVYVLARRALKRRRLVEERKSAVENMRSIVF